MSDIDAISRRDEQLKETFEDSTSDDIDLDSSLGSMGAVSGAISKHYSLKPTMSSPDQRVFLKPRMEKKRSYTTSILVSPRPDRKPVLSQKQQSIDDANSPNICSDDVTIDVAKVGCNLCLLPSRVRISRLAVIAVYCFDNFTLYFCVISNVEIVKGSLWNFLNNVSLPKGEYLASLSCNFMVLPSEYNST